MKVRLNLKELIKNPLKNIEDKLPEMLLKCIESAKLKWNVTFQDILVNLSPGIDHHIFKRNFSSELSRVLNTPEKMEMKNVWMGAAYNETAFYAFCMPPYKKYKWFLYFLLYRLGDLELEDLLYQQCILELIRLVQVEDTTPNQKKNTKGDVVMDKMINPIINKTKMDAINLVSRLYAIRHPKPTTTTTQPITKTKELSPEDRALLEDRISEHREDYD